jgi:hypothetical protein
MRNLLLLLFAVSSALFACNDSTNNTHEGHDMTGMAKDSAMPATATADPDVKTIPVMFTGIDPKASASIKEIVDHYLHIKNALAGDNSDEAASGAKAMAAAMKNLDKSLLSTEQKTAYDKTEDDLEEHAEHIATNAGKIDHQRSHFSMMSEDIYELVKNFGAGRPMYHDHCPMAKDNQGAMWMSENKDIKNPYFGNKMPTCGSVEEVIR